MKTSLIKIGNSRGVRIPKTMIEECGLTEEVDIAVRNGTVVIAPAGRPRAGWDEAFAEMAERGDDEPLLPEGLSEESDETEWIW